MTASVTAQDDALLRARIEAALESFVVAKRSDLDVLGPDARRLLAAARTSVSGGKRLRGSFCYWGFRAVSATVPDEDALVRAAAALELLHASALVHDDLMDASETRRGVPAAHAAFARLHRESHWRGEAASYGAAAAILLGDLLLSWSDELLRRSGLPEAGVGAAMDYFDATRSEVIVGQFLDVSVQARGSSDVEEAMRVLRYKSAKYSVERPLNVGAALAGADDEQQRQLSGFGLPLGEAFQLRDDLLGVYGDPAVTGKPAGDDLTEGKRTVLVAVAMRRAGPAERERLDTSLGRPLDDREVDDLREIITGCGAQAEVERRIDALTEQSLAALTASTVSRPARGALLDLARAATQRVG